MNNPAVAYAAADLRNIVQMIVDNYNVASTGQAEWYPVAFFLKDEDGDVLRGLLGDIWAVWLHVRTLAVAAPARGRGFGKELIKRAERFAVERGCADAFLDTFSFQARPFYEKRGYRVFGTLCKITLFEAEPRLGGKVSTERFKTAPILYEAGVAELYDYSYFGLHHFGAPRCRISLKHAFSDGRDFLLNRIGPRTVSP